MTEAINKIGDGITKWLYFRGWFRWLFFRTRFIFDVFFRSTFCAWSRFGFSFIDRRFKWFSLRIICDWFFLFFVSGWILPIFPIRIWWNAFFRRRLLRNRRRFLRFDFRRRRCLINNYWWRFLRFAFSRSFCLQFIAFFRNFPFFFRLHQFIDRFIFFHISRLFIFLFLNFLFVLVMVSDVDRSVKMIIFIYRTGKNNINFVMEWNE